MDSQDIDTNEPVHTDSVRSDKDPLESQDPQTISTGPPTPTSSSSPRSSPALPQQGISGSGPDDTVQHSQTDDLEKDTAQRDPPPSAQLITANLGNQSDESETDFPAENIGEGQESALMSEERGLCCGVKGEGVEGETSREGSVYVNASSNKEISIDKSSSEACTASGSMISDGGGGSGSGVECTDRDPDAAAPSPEDIVVQAAITASELAAAAKQDTLSGGNLDSSMTSSTAMCKYRWAKVVATDSADVGFYPSYAPTDPILLSWDASFKAYLSPELRIECGNYHGVLKVNGNALHVEDFVVKSYTFEVDLFIKEDILETKCPSPPTLEFRSSPSNPGCAAPIPTSTLAQSDSTANDGSETSKIEDIVLPQLNPKGDPDLTPTREPSGILASSSSNHLERLDRNSSLNHSAGVDDILTSSILKSSSPLHSLPVRRASPIGDDKSGEQLAMAESSEYFDSTRTRGERERPISSGTDRTPLVANDSSTQSNAASKLVDDIIGGRIGREKDDDGLPARGSSSIGTYRFEEFETFSSYKKQDREDKQRPENGSDPNLSYPARSGPATVNSNEERTSSHHSSKDSQSQSQRPTDGIYGRPPSQPSTDRKDEEPAGYTSRGSASSTGRYQDYDSRSTGTSPSRDRNRDADTDYSLGNRDRLPKRDADDEYIRSGSRPPSGLSNNGYRDSNQTKDGRHGSYADVEGRPRSSMSRGSREGSYMGSQHSSRAGSHTSLTSEQELGQYWDNDRRGNSEASRERTQFNEVLVDPSGPRGGRLERPSSMPNYGANPESENAKRSSTPDNRVRVPPPSSSWARSDSRAAAAPRPALRNPLSTDRMDEVLGGRSSVMSSDGRRTVTPGLGNREHEASEAEDLRNTVENLRQLVTRRDSEIRILRDELHEVKDSRSSSRQREPRTAHSSLSADKVQNSLEYKQLQSEKEILATEVVSLREEVQRLTGRHSSSGRHGEAGGEGGRHGSAISDYSPYSPMVLQRKIGDLESQIHDLQEVNEATTSSLSRTEEKVRLLQEENHDLRAKTGNNFEDSGDQHSLRVQLRTVKEDLASLRERNFQLTEENMRLQESQRSGLTAVAAGLSSLQRSGSSLGLKSDESQSKHSSTHVGSSTSNYVPRYPASSSKGSESSRQLLGYTSSRISREDLAPKDYRSRGSSLGRAYDSDHQSSTPDAASARLLHQRNAQDSPRLRFSSSGSDAISHKPPNSASMTSRSAVSGPLSVAERDRSRPDGEVSEHIHTDRYRPGVRSSYDSLDRQERVTKSNSKESHSHKSGSYSFRKERSGALNKDNYGDYRREDSYMAYLSDSKLDRSSNGNQPKRSSARDSLGSKDIFMNLKKKLASQWLQQENRYISGNLEFDRYQATSSRDRVEEDGDDSDTATDILLAQDTGTPQVSFQSDKSPRLDGGGGSSSDEAAAEDINGSGYLGGSASLRRRCRSADAAGNSRHTDPWRNNTGANPHGSSSGGSNTRNYQQPSTTGGHRSQRSSAGHGAGPGTSSSYRGTSSSLAASSGDDGMRSTSTAGHRSVIPTPLVTQHNKHELAKNGASLLNSTLTQGLRPFAPRSPADIRVDDVVKFSRLGGKLTQGCVKYVGHLPGRSEVYLGVELDRDEGKHDGTFEETRYFKCKANKGVFVAFNKIVMAWAP